MPRALTAPRRLKTASAAFVILAHVASYALMSLLALAGLWRMRSPRT